MVPYPCYGAIDRVSGLGPDGNTLADVHQKVLPDAEKRVEFTLFFRYSRAVGQHKPGNDDNRSKNHFAQLHACSLLLQRCLHLPLFPSGTHNTFS